MKMKHIFSFIAGHAISGIYIYIYIYFFLGGGGGGD